MSTVAHHRILIDDYFDIIVQTKASDLHLQEGQPPKMRLHGDIIIVPGYEQQLLTHELMTQMLSEVAGPRRWEAFVKKGDADLAYELNE